MGVIFRVAIRNMKRRKSRYILTTITLIIGVALFGGMLIVRDSVRVMFVNDIDNRMGTADILIRENEWQDRWFTAEDLDDIEDLSHVEYISYRIAGFYIYSSSTPNGNQLYNSTKTAVYGIDVDSEDERELGGKPYIIDSAVEGDSIEEIIKNGINEYGINTIVITESLQIKLGKDFKAGDEIWILPINYKITGKTAEEIADNTALWPTYTVAAIIRDLGEARDFQPSTPSTFSIPSLVPCLFADIETTYDLVDGGVNREGQYNLAAVGIDDINNIEDVVAAIKDKLGPDWRVADLKSDLIDDINDSVDLIMTLFLIFALLSLILSLILILNIFNIIKEELEYETGILQSIGASGSETFKVFLIQGIVMGIIGATIGTICSYFMSNLIFYITVESLKNMPGEAGEVFAETEGEIILYPQTIAITFAIGLISCILAAIYPSWKASRKPPIENLHLHARKLKQQKRHLIRKVISFILAVILTFYGIYLIYGGIFYDPIRRSLGITTVSIIAPTLILLGLIGIAAVFVGPITRVFIRIFEPYLRQTKLLTKKNVLRNRRRTVLTFSMISLTISYLIGVSVIMGSFREGVQTTVNDVMGCDIRIFTANTPRSFEEEIKDIDGVDDAMGVSYLTVQLWHEDKEQWIGHGLTDKAWGKSIKGHILDTETIKDHMTSTKILEPSDMTLEEMMDDLSEEKNSIIITKSEAIYFNLDVDDEIMAKFSIGISYPTIIDMLNDNRVNAHESIVNINMKVIAIVENFQGFASFGILGQAEDSFNVFISWETYEDFVSYDLPGGNTDIILREKPQSGNEGVDNYMPNWFNFSDVYPILEGISDIDYYTTRMDYTKATYNLDLGFDYDNIVDDVKNYNLYSSVVGIRTNSSNNIVDDSYFGQHELIRKSAEDQRTTMEELLNSTDKVCVVDETYFNVMRIMDPSFDIGSNISIFPQLYSSNLDTIFTGGPAIPLSSNPPYTYVTLRKGSIVHGNESAFEISNNDNMTILSNKNSLNFNISVNLGYYLYIYKHFINFYNITIESRVNSTVDKLDLEVFNYLTNKFDKLGDINSKIEKNHTFTFNQYYSPLSYINQSTFDLTFRIVGDNSTFSNNFSLDIDMLEIKVNSSIYELDPLTWPNYTVIGVIEDPLLYQTERITWDARFELSYDISLMQNAVYINYENARSQIYPNKSGSAINGTNDKITHVFIHCDNVYNIEKTASLLQNALGSNWTVLDLKTGSPDIPNTLKFRLNVFDWYIWIEEGEDDEEILRDLIEYLEDKGYYVTMAFTKSYVIKIFKSMLDLITMIMYGILVFAILIAMIGLTLHCLVSTMARRREIGMLRSIGLSKKGVIRTISGETLVVASLGTILGIFAGLLTGVLMVTHMPGTIFLATTLTIPWLIINVIIITTLITAFISSRYPSRWAANINIVDALRTL